MKDIAKIELHSEVLAESLRHGAHVAHLAMELFDGLYPLHKLSKKWRNILDLGAQLHDIGWIFGKKAHHKYSASMIIDGDIKKARAVPQKIRHLVALVARYHRRANPSLEHEEFAQLKAEEQKAIQILASIIRLADALDFSHSKSVGSLQVSIHEHEVQLSLFPSNNSDILVEISRIQRKKELFVHIFLLDVVGHSC